MDEFLLWVDKYTPLLMLVMVFLQTVFIGWAFFWGWSYLEQHRKKIQKEKEIHLIMDSLNQLNDFRRLFRRYILITGTKYVDFLSSYGKDMKALEEILEEFYSNRRKYVDELETVMQNMDTNLFLLDNLSLIENWRIIADQFRLITNKYQWLNSRFKDNDPEGLDQFLMTIPKSLNPVNNEIMISFLKEYDELRDGLKKMYVSKEKSPII